MNSLRIINVKQIKNGYCQLTFAQLIVNPTRTTGRGMASRFNKSNPAFAAPKPRQAWESGMPQDMAEIFPEIAADITEVMAGSEGTSKDIDFTVPSSENMNIEVVEDHTPRYATQKPKTAGRDGDTILHNNMPIYSHTDLVDGPANHVWLVADTTPVATPVAPTAEGMGAAQ